MYARDLEMKILKARLSTKHGGMWEFAKLLTKMKKAKLYRQLGYASFEDWFIETGFPRSTIYTWMNLERTYCDKRGFKIESLEEIENRILKCFLPLARSDQIQTHELWGEIIAATNMKFSEFLQKLPKLKKRYKIIDS